PSATAGPGRRPKRRAIFRSRRPPSKICASAKPPALAARSSGQTVACNSQCMTRRSAIYSFFERGAALSREQFLQPFGDLLGRTFVGEAGGEPALRVHDIDD